MSEKFVEKTPRITVLVLNIPFWVQNNSSKDLLKNYISLKGPFWGQKELFKKILGPILGFFCLFIVARPQIRNTGQNEQLSKRVGILKGTRAEYEKQILATLSQELNAE